MKSMVVVEFPIKELMKESRLTEKEVMEGLTSIGAPNERVEDRLIIELTPNRPDWFAFGGLTRALRTYYEKEAPKLEKYSVKKSDYVTIVDKSVEKIRPYTVNTVIKNIKLTDERIKNLVQLQDKLSTTLGRKVKKFGMGFFDLDQIAFPVKYTTRKPHEIRYKPLNYLKEADANEILEKHPKGWEFGQYIEGHAEYPVFLDANNKVLVLIPIVNAAGVGEINEKTTNLFLEVTGMELEAVKSALRILVCECIDLGGTAYEVEMRYHNKKFKSPGLEPKKMKLDRKWMNGLLGIELSKKEMDASLVRMGYEVTGDVVLIPPYRADVMHLVDILEDVAIAYGYNEFKPEPPAFYHEGKIVSREEDGVAHLLRGLGFMEVKTFSLTSEEKLAVFSLKGERAVNPASVDYCTIRPLLLPSLLDVFIVNKMAGLPQKIYEVGVVYNKNNGQEKKVCFGLMDKKIDFAQARSNMQTLLKELGLDYTVEKSMISWFDKEKQCKVLLKNKEIGSFGALSSKIKEKYGLEFDVYFCELSLF